MANDDKDIAEKEDAPVEEVVDMDKVDDDDSVSDDGDDDDDDVVAEDDAEEKDSDK